MTTRRSTATTARSPFHLDVSRLHAELTPIVRAVLAKNAKGALPAAAADGPSKQEDDERTMYATHMLGMVLRHIIANETLRSVNTAEIEFGDKPEVACLKGKNLKVKEMLGQGAYGRVFAIDANKAVKLTLLEIGRWDSHVNAAREKYDREAEMARIAAKLGVGPAIMDTFVCTSRHQMKHYGVIVMKRLHGTDLSTWIRKASKVQRDKMGKHLDAMIQKMHAGGLYHNDLHPGNVMVLKGDKPMFVDFGLAAKASNYDPFGRGKGIKRHRDYNLLDRIASYDEQSHESSNGIDRLITLVIKRALEAGVINIQV